MVMPKSKFALLPLAVCIASGSAFAATNAELEKRLEAQEKQIKKLERRLKGTRGAVKQNRSRISDLSDRFKVNGFFSSGVKVGDGDDVSLDGFDTSSNYSTDEASRLGIQMSFEVSDDMSVTGQLVSRGDNDYDITAEWAYLSWNVTDNFTARVGRQRIPYYLLSEYLDVGFAYPWVSPPIELYNLPVSNTDGIGLLYDFTVGETNLSTQMYGGAGGGRSEELGGTFKQNHSWGIAQFVEWRDFTFRVGFNTSSLDVGDIDENGLGGQLLDGLETVAGVVPGLDPVSSSNIRTEYLSAAMNYDNGSLLVIAEIANLRVKDFLQPAGDGGYLTVGYRFGDWMPHVTYSKFYTDSKNDETVRKYMDGIIAAQPGLAAAVSAGAATEAVAAANQQALLLTGVPLSGAAEAAITAQATAEATAAVTSNLVALHNGLSSLVSQQESYTLGLTYNINPRVKAKIEATHYEGFGSYDNLTGIDAGTPSFQSVSGIGRFSGDADAIDGHTAIYSFSVDAVF